MFDVATAAVEGALAAGATYADARAQVRRTEAIRVNNSVVESLRQNEGAGIGVRALIGSSWGFFATPDLSTAAARKAGEEAAAIARASAKVAGPPLVLADVPAANDHWASHFDENPFEVGLGDKVDMLVGVTGAMKAAGADLAIASTAAWDTETWFVSSQGARISQKIVECGGYSEAT